MVFVTCGLAFLLFAFCCMGGNTRRAYPFLFGDPRGEFTAVDATGVEADAIGTLHQSPAGPVAEDDALGQFLTEAGIGNAVYYPRPLHLQECFAHLGYRVGQLPVAEQACDEVLALPIFPELRDGQQQAVIDRIAAFFDAQAPTS